MLGISCTTKNNVDVKDYPIITTVGDLSNYYELNIDTSGNFEKTSLISYFDGSKELSYEYDLLETEQFDPLYYSISVTQEKTIKDAKESYAIEMGALKLVGNSFEQGTIDIDSLVLPGDENYYALRTYEGSTNGLFFMVRKGKKIYSLVVSGMYTTDHSLIYDLVLPQLEELESLDLTKA